MQQTSSPWAGYFSRLHIAESYEIYRYLSRDPPLTLLTCVYILRGTPLARSPPLKLPHRQSVYQAPPDSLRSMIDLIVYTPYRGYKQRAFSQRVAGRGVVSTFDGGPSHVSTTRHEHPASYASMDALQACFTYTFGISDASAGSLQRALFQRALNIL